MFWPRKTDIYIYIYIVIKINNKCEVWHINDNLKIKHFLLSCRRVVWIIIIIICNILQYIWQWKNPWKCLWENKHWSLAKLRPLLLQNLPVSSKYPHNSLRRCCKSLIVTVNVHRYLDASYSHSKPLSQLKNSQGPLLRPRLRFLCFFKGGLLPNFQVIF